MWADLSRFLSRGLTIRLTIPSPFSLKRNLLFLSVGWIPETSASSRIVGRHFKHSRLGLGTVSGESEYSYAYSYFEYRANGCVLAALHMQK
jgi:hypothetical protein